MDAFLTNEGGGAAFNIRFGVEFGRIRYPHKLHVDDPDAGDVQRVMQTQERLPRQGSWSILIPSLSMWGRAAEAEGELDSSRLYWARYENARGQTWETRNPPGRSARLDIRRVRFVRLREWRERRASEMAGKRDIAWERRALAELLSGMKDDQPNEPH